MASSCACEGSVCNDDCCASDNAVGGVDGGGTTVGGYEGDRGGRGWRIQMRRNFFVSKLPSIETETQLEREGTRLVKNQRSKCTTS
jgi:hypothetical protein